MNGSNRGQALGIAASYIAVLCGVIGAMVLGQFEDSTPFLAIGMVWFAIGVLAGRLWCFGTVLVLPIVAALVDPSVFGYPGETPPWVSMLFVAVLVALPLSVLGVMVRLVYSGLRSGSRKL